MSDEHCRGAGMIGEILLGISLVGLVIVFAFLAYTYPETPHDSTSPLRRSDDDIPISPTIQSTFVSSSDPAPAPIVDIDCSAGFASSDGGSCGDGGCGGDGGGGGCD